MPPRLLPFLFLTLGGLLHAAEPTWFKIHSRWYQNEWLGEEQGQAVCKEGDGDAFRWRTEEKDGKLRLLNKATGHALEAAASGVTPCAATRNEAPNQWWTPATISAHWQSFRSDQGKYLNIEHRLGGPASDMDAAPTEQDRWSGQWEMIHAAGPPPPRGIPRNTVAVVAPEYGSDIAAGAKIEILAPGLKEIEITTWKDGKPVKLATLQLSETGGGSFDFKADGFPRGPITLKLHGTNGTESDNCFLVLYHTSGPDKAKAGAAPPQAKGMKELFVDDFDRLPAISPSGKDATYAAHKPGGGDFSGIPFADPSGPANPFSQRDGLLRIRASEALNSTGLLSSLRADGTGIVAKAPCYFECRFIAQSATGTWPAFWLMTQQTYKGGNTPVDELDVIEAYGGEGPGNPNFPGYEATSHYWNQGDDGKKDTAQPGIHGPISMTTLPGLRGSSWYDEFHTYGVKVGKDDTIYYCDNVEIGRHPTGRLSKEEPFFFFINFAIGGISGWKKDLSRYAGIADMYVDYVRVYQGN
ncbi:MAG: hypothetical protein JWO82_4133 [Akkermansiaceae bacterium]|nr:hypothetical protein [Akkermansiaceae bacterium]